MIRESLDLEDKINLMSIFEKGKLIMKKVNESLILMHKISGRFFYDILRKYLLGFKNVVFEGTDYIAENLPGGTGGMDPTYQIIESILGINYTEIPN